MTKQKVETKDKYNIRNAYSIYKKNCKDHLIEPLSYSNYRKEYRNIMDIFYEVLLTGKSVTLPYIGTFQVLGKTITPKVSEDGKILNLPVDWKSTLELWRNDPQAKLDKKRIFYFNDHTNGVQYHYNWSKKKVIIPNKTVYNFYSMRKRNRDLGKHIMDGNQNFIIL